jgi:hypothetical protein
MRVKSSRIEDRIDVVWPAKDRVFGSGLEVGTLQACPKRGGAQVSFGEPADSNGEKIARASPAAMSELEFTFALCCASCRRSIPPAHAIRRHHEELCASFLCDC